MEIVREIERHFASLEEGQQDLSNRLDAMDQTMRTMVASMSAMQTSMKAVADRSRSMQQEMSAVRGCFAGVEAMLIANAAQMVDVMRRLDALEKRAS